MTIQEEILIWSHLEKKKLYDKTCPAIAEHAWFMEAIR